MDIADRKIFNPNPNWKNGLMDDSLFIWDYWSRGDVLINKSIRPAILTVYWSSHVVVLREPSLVVRLLFKVHGTALNFFLFDVAIEPMISHLLGGDDISNDN